MGLNNFLTDEIRCYCFGVGDSKGCDLAHTDQLFLHKLYMLRQCRRDPEELPECFFVNL